MKIILKLSNQCSGIKQVARVEKTVQFFQLSLISFRVPYKFK